MSAPSTTTFHWDAIKWLREEMAFATEVRPADRVDEPNAPLRIEGFLVRPSRAGSYAYAGLCVLTAALLLVMLGMPGIGEATEHLLHRTGQAGLIVAAGLFVAAWVVSRRSRSPALVQLHPSAAPATAESVTALHGTAGGAALWIVTEQAPGAEVIETAAQLGVRCFIRTADGRFAPAVAR